MKSAIVPRATASTPGSFSLGKHGMAGLLLFSMVVRVIGLSSFPVIQADEGLWTRSSKNFVLFGNWFLDSHTHVFLSPVFHALSVALFWLLGPSTAHARLVSAGAGTASIWLLWLLVARLTHREDLSLATAVFFGMSEWAIVSSRQALIEPLQLMWLLATLCTLVSGNGRGVVLGSLAFSAAMLTKINSVFLFPIALVLALLHGEEGLRLRITNGGMQRAVVFAAVSLGLAGSVYGVLYLQSPNQFVSAFTFELNGVHFESLSHPLLRLGRFGLDPIQAGRSVLALFREEPFLLVLSVLGISTTASCMEAASIVFGSWMAVGMAFFLLQMVQPLRYFFLVLPAIAFFAARFTCWCDEGRSTIGPATHSMARRVLIAFVAFDLAYSAMNALSNREVRVPAVRSWMAAHSKPNDRVLSSALIATDLPNRTFAFYRVLADTSTLLSTIHTLHIRYVVLDEEWPSPYRRAVAASLSLAQQWPFAQVYEVTDKPER